jgi:heat shock protein HslJ
LTISNHGANFTQCNLVDLAYTASSNKTIKFKLIGKTKMFCPNDKDDLYVKALESAVKYSENKGVHIF